MYTSGWTAEELELAMVRTYMRYQNNIKFVNDLNMRSKRVCTNVRIKPIRSFRLLVRDRIERDVMYRPGVLVRSTMSGGERSCGACCWHSYGMFIRTLFDINNDGWMNTREAKYVGLQGFLESYPATGGHIKGGLCNGEAYEYMCKCYEYDLTEF